MARQDLMSHAPTMRTTHPHNASPVVSPAQRDESESRGSAGMRWAAAVAIAITTIGLIESLAPLDLPAVALAGVVATVLSVTVSGLREGCLTAGLLWLAALVSTATAPFTAEPLTAADLIGLGGLVALVPAAFKLRDRLRATRNAKLDNEFIQRFPAAALRTGADGSLQSVNGAAASLLARPGSDLIGRRLQSIVRLPGTDGRDAELDLSALGQPTDAVVIGPSGERRDVRAQAVPLDAGHAAPFAVHLQSVEPPGAALAAGLHPKLLQSMLDAADSAISIKLADRRYALANRAFCMRFGTGEASLLGRTSEEVFDAALAAALTAPEEAVWQGEQRTAAEQRLPAPTAVQHVWRDTFGLLNDAGETYAVCSVFTDLAAIDAQLQDCRQQLDAERTARRDAERINTARDEFVGLVSHELRTPLNAMVGWLHVLESGRDFGEQAMGRASAGLGRAVRQQRDLVDTLLETARALRGDLQLDPKRFDLDALVASAVDARRELAPALRVNLRRAGCACMIEADEKRLRYVLDELLAHAAKFADVAALDLQVRLERLPDQCRLQVGFRFADAAADAAWEPFREPQDDAQAPAKRRRGLGIGLVLAQRIVELSGGCLGVLDGTPSELELRIGPVEPIAASAATGAGTHSTIGSAAMLSGLRVLIVDDQADMRDVLETVLTQSGASVCSAASADEAATCYVEMASSGQIDLGIFDIAMPVEDGIGLVKRLRQIEQARQLAHVPMIALTAHASPSMREQALAAGFDRFLAKPVLPAELYDTILGAVGHKSV